MVSSRLSPIKVTCFLVGGNDQLFGIIEASFDENESRPVTVGGHCVNGCLEGGEISAAVSSHHHVGVGRLCSQGPRKCQKQQECEEFYWEFHNR